MDLVALNSNISFGIVPENICNNFNEVKITNVAATTGFVVTDNEAIYKMKATVCVGLTITCLAYQGFFSGYWKSYEKTTYNTSADSCLYYLYYYGYDGRYADFTGSVKMPECKGEFCCKVQRTSVDSITAYVTFVNYHKIGSFYTNSLMKGRICMYTHLDPLAVTCNREKYWIMIDPPPTTLVYQPAYIQFLNSTVISFQQRNYTFFKRKCSYLSHGKYWALSDQDVFFSHTVFNYWNVCTIDQYMLAPYLSVSIPKNPIKDDFNTLVEIMRVDQCQMLKDAIITQQQFLVNDFKWTIALKNGTQRLHILHNKTIFEAEFLTCEKCSNITSVCKLLRDIKDYIDSNTTLLNCTFDSSGCYCHDLFIAGMLLNPQGRLIDPYAGALFDYYNFPTYDLLSMGYYNYSLLDQLQLYMGGQKIGEKYYNQDFFSWLAQKVGESLAIVSMVFIILGAVLILILFCMFIKRVCISCLQKD